MSKKTGFTITLEDSALSKQIDEAIKRNPKETVLAVRSCLQDLAGRSARIAPIESGDLRNDCAASLNGTSIFAKQTKMSNHTAGSLQASGEVSYGLPYALRQHEDLSLPHDRTDGYRRADGSTVNMIPGGQAKFLEKPFEQNKARYLSRLQRIPTEVVK